MPEKKNRLRCRHCHLTIDVDELGGAHCPECFELDGKKRYEFEELGAVGRGATRYRCAGCGVVIECE